MRRSLCRIVQRCREEAGSDCATETAKNRRLVSGVDVTVIITFPFPLCSLRSTACRVNFSQGEVRVTLARAKVRRLSGCLTLSFQTWPPPQVNPAHCENPNPYLCTYSCAEKQSPPASSSGSGAKSPLSRRTHSLNMSLQCYQKTKIIRSKRNANVKRKQKMWPINNNCVGRYWTRSNEPTVDSGYR